MRWLIGLLLFITGILVGLGIPVVWAPSHGLESRWEATVYLPASVPGDPHLNEDAWKAALTEFSRPFGGATLAQPVEGVWHAGDGSLQREPIRPVIISFAASRLPEFREQLRILRERLNQEALYIRYERPWVELHTR